MIKNGLLSNPQRRILYLSKTYEGSMHDKKICDLENYSFPHGITLVQDNGYQGYKPEGVIIIQPEKKPKGKELTTQQKETNKAKSKIRVVVEHAIGGIKRCRIVKDILRNWKNGFADMIMGIACGLHNFRVTFRTSPLII